MSKYDAHTGKQIQQRKFQLLRWLWNLAVCCKACGCLMTLWGLLEVRCTHCVVRASAWKLAAVQYTWVTYTPR